MGEPDDDSGRPREAPSAPPREEMPTITDPAELEAARVISTFTSPPPSIEVSEVEISEEMLLGDSPNRAASASSPDMLRYVPAIVMDPEKLAAQALDHRAGFVLSLIQGTLSIQAILDMSGLPGRETVAILRDLHRRGVVVFRAPRAKPGAKRPPAAPTYRVIAEGEDAVAEALTLGEALIVLESARARGKRHVAIVDEATGAMLDEADARAAIKRT